MAVDPGRAKARPARSTPDRPGAFLAFCRGMDWPLEQVEALDPAWFRPPFCPWPACRGHRTDHFRGHRHGWFVRKSDGRRVPRFRCRLCGRTLSQQTFAFSYYLKRPHLGPVTAAALQAGSANRQIARSTGCAPSTITRLGERLGRHALLLLARAVESLPGLKEAVVFDHFETFALAQEYALGVATAVGAGSWFVYALDASPHRRAGRRTAKQRSRQPFLKYPDSGGGYAASLSRVIDVLGKLPAPERGLQLVTDGHPAYRRAVGTTPRHVQHWIFTRRHRPSNLALRPALLRDGDRAMFPNDSLHALLRHTCAHHRRETIAFARRHNAVMERMFLSAVWRNFVKQRSERRPDGITPAMRLGLASHRWRWREVLYCRLFPDRLAVPRAWLSIYRRGLATPALPSNRAHALSNAF
jgi:transposase-like protein